MRASSALGPEGRLAVGHAGAVLLIEVATGQTVWERSLAEVASPCAGQPVSLAMAGGAVLAGSMGHVFALAIADGAVLWHVDHRQRGDGATSLAVMLAADEFVSSLGFVPRD